MQGFAYFSIPIYLDFFENASIDSNIGHNSHNPKPYACFLLNASASINLLATCTSHNIIHPIIGTNNSSNHHGRIPHRFSGTR